MNTDKCVYAETIAKQHEELNALAAQKTAMLREAMAEKGLALNQRKGEAIVQYTGAGAAKATKETFEKGKIATEEVKAE
eukprot:9654704-Lingulodinium_polyedra.AAC.1